MTSMRRTILVAIVAIGMPFLASGLDKQIGYAGFLTDTSGFHPLADNNYYLVFSIYNVATGGTALWSDTFYVYTVSGEFSVMLGSVVPLTLDFSSDTNYWLGVKVSLTSPVTTPEMTPRK